MRTLTNLAGKNVLSPTIRLTLDSRDGAETFVHCSHADDGIVDISPISWQGPAMGGLGLPSGYNVTLGFPDFDGLDTIKTRLPKYNMATAALRIDVGSETIHPHVGRVRSVKRNGDDPNTLNLTIVDRIVDDNPMIPKTAIVDSYSGVHPEEQNANAGYPWYYGDERLRDFYMTAIDCDIDIMLGPRNISSVSHISSVWFNSDGNKGSDTNDKHILLTTFLTWNQQSTSNNRISGLSAYQPFGIRGVGPLDTRFWEFEKYISGQKGTVTVSHGFLEIANNGYLDIVAETRDTTPDQGRCNVVMVKKIPQEIDAVTVIEFSTQLNNVESITTHLIEIRTDSGDSFLVQSLYNATVATLTNQIAVKNDVGQYIFTEGGRRSYLRQFTFGTFIDASIATTWQTSMHIYARLKSEGYRRFSIFAPKATADRTAISENPIAILDHINSWDTSIPFLTNQSSTAQSSLEGDYKFHCFFADRRPTVEILKEFGEITATNMWIGDSGMLNYRVYAESADATIDKTLNRDDFIAGTFGLEENPIGTSQHDQKLASDITINHTYDFQKGKYEISERAFPANTALCNSLSAAGITRAMERKTQYIMNIDTASRYLGNLVRKYTQGTEFASGQLSAEHFDLELNDVVKIRHEMIVGSESLYQITKLSHDYMQGLVEFTAAELLSTNPT